MKITINSLLHKYYQLQHEWYIHLSHGDMNKSDFYKKSSEMRNKIEELKNKLCSPEILDVLEQEVEIE